MQNVQSLNVTGKSVFFWLMVLIVGCGENTKILEPEQSTPVKGDTQADHAETEKIPGETTDISETSDQGDDDGGPDHSQTTRNKAKDSAADEKKEPCYKADSFVCEVEYLITAQVNSKRHATNQIRYDKKLAFVARNWSESQGKNGVLGHQGFPKERQALYKSEFSEEGVFSGEAVASIEAKFAKTKMELAHQIVESFHNDPNNRVLVIGNYKALGVGVVRHGEKFYVTLILSK